MRANRVQATYRQHHADPVEQRVNEHASLVKKIAYHMVSKLPPSVEVDDLIQAGLIGLMEAARNYDPLAGAQFETFATQRIRGAMLDELREADWLPRQARKDMRKIEAAITKLEHEFGRPPSESEIAQSMELPLPDYQHMLLEARGHQLIHYEDLQENDELGEALDQIVADTDANPLNGLADEDFKRILISGIEALPDREKLLMALYYDEELNLKEIGAVLGVTESRVSQLHSQAIGRLRARLKDWLHTG